MNKIRSLIFVTAAAFLLAGCEPAANTNTANSNAGNTKSNSNANANAAKPVAAAPTKDELVAIEKKGWDAWKARDASAMGALLSDRYVGFSSAGRVDKAGSLKTLEQKCEVKSYTFSDEQVHPIGTDIAVLSFRAAQDYTCDGKKGPADVWSSAVYVREGDTWKSVYYSESPVLDPKAPAPKAAAPGVVQKDAKYDDITKALMAVENQAWGAWKTRDSKGIEGAMAREFWYVGENGRRDKAAALKGWAESKCDGLDFTLTEPKGVSLSKDVGLVTYKADVKGKCDGRQNPPTLWVASISVKEGDAWKNAYYTDINR